jgi:hypothetical protein
MQTGVYKKAEHVCPAVPNNEKIADPQGQYSGATSWLRDGVTANYNCVLWALMIVNCFLRKVTQQDLPELLLKKHDITDKFRPASLVWQ